MFRHAFTSTLMAVILFCSPHFVVAQVGIPPSQRAPTGQPGSVRQIPDRSAPTPSAAEIWRLLFPPEQFVPNDGTFDQTSPPQTPSPPPSARVPTRQEVARLTPHQQRALLRKATQSLDEEFDRLATGAGWKQHLQIESLGRMLWCGASISPDADSRAVLMAIADRLDEVAGNPQYQAIQRLWGFQTARAALREYAIDPLELSKRELEASSQTLLRSLLGIRTGASWRRFLQADDLIRLAESKESPSSMERDFLRQIADKFNKVAENPDFRAVAHLDGFLTTHRNLRKLASHIQQLQSSTSAANAQLILATLSSDLQAVNRASQQRLTAQALWEQATANSRAAEEARKMLLDAKENQQEATAKSQQQMQKLQQLITQTLEEHRKATDPQGVVTVLPLEQDDPDRSQMIASLVASMRSVKRISQEKTKAEQAWSRAVDGSDVAEAAKKKVLAEQVRQNQAKSLSQEQLDKLRKFIRYSIAEQKAKQAAEGGVLKLLQLEEDVEDETVTLMQFDDQTEERATVTLLQFQEETVSTPVEVTLVQFKEAADCTPEEITLMQFTEATDAKPAETILMQFKGSD